METLEQLSGTLDSLDELRGIVRTMKALAAVSIRQYERAATSLEQYRRTVDLGLQSVARALPPAPVRPRGVPTVRGAIAFGSDHGLCGRFNEDVADALRAHARETPDSRLRVLVVGARLGALLDDAPITIDETLATPGSAPRITTLVDRLLVLLEAWQSESGVDTVSLCVSERRGGGRATPVVQPLLPIDLAAIRRLAATPWPSPSLPTLGMDREALLAALVRQHLFVSLFRACAESQAAEHASRLAAMQRASRNLDDRRTELMAEFRRRRQAVITAELLDVVSGYEAIRHATAAGDRGPSAPASS